MDDNEIIELFWQRDENAIRETELKYGKKLNNLAFRILGSRDDAEESVNDTLFRAWSSIPPTRPTYYYAYIAKICRYVSFGKLDWENAKKRQAEIVTLTEEMELCIPAPMEQEIDDEKIGRILNTFLEGLSKEKRLIFMRRYWYEDSIQSIAVKYHVGESKVKTTLYRLRKELRKYLEKEMEP